MLRNRVSKRSVISISLGLLALAVLAAMTIPLMPRAAQASGGSGHLHLTKTCPPTTFSGMLGSPSNYCTITSSSLPTEIPVGSTVYYDYPIILSTPNGIFDTDAVLFVGIGDWAVGHCTLDATTNLGLCTFSDGTGRLTGFTARVNVSSPFPPSSADFGIDYTWDGMYSFTP